MFHLKNKFNTKYNVAGIYFHIPFCKQACNYCDFHFSTSLKHKDDLLNALKTELQLRKDEIQKHEIQTIYFGGGTPSLLDVREIQSLFEEIQKLTDLSSVKEITLEANPDDLSRQYLTDLSKTPINRLSIGVQSFFEDDLKWMNRSHNAKQALNCIPNAQDVGLSNITIDLIYGSPTTSNEKWKKNLDLWNQLNLYHLSAYHLTVEEKTPLATQIKKGQINAISETKGEQQFQILIDFIEHKYLNHYEISNIARNETTIALHNTSYWQNKPYIGIGPSSHSFDGINTRLFNPSNNIKYINSMQKRSLCYQIESLSEIELYNEFILTRMRMQRGISEKEFKRWNKIKKWNVFLKEISPYIESNQIHYNQNSELIFLTNHGKKFADSIAMNSMIVE